MSKITNTDLLLIQRQDTSASKELYSIPVGEFSKYAISQSDAYMMDLTDQVDENTENINLLEGSITILANEVTILKLDSTRHDTEINQLQQQVVNLNDSLHELQSDAKVNLNYRWIEFDDDVDPTLLESGQMAADFDAYTGEVIKLYYSTTDEDGYAVSQPYIFEGETLELSSAYRPDPSNTSKLRYRSIHLVTTPPEFESTYLYFEVKTLHRYDGYAGYPYFTDEDYYITRSDFHPNGTVIEEFEQHVEDSYLPLDGSKNMTGTLEIISDEAKIHLETNNGGDEILSAANRLRILHQGLYPRLDIGATIEVSTNLDMKNQKIIGLNESSVSSHAATVGYVDKQIAGVQSNLDETFKPGDQVAANSMSDVDPGGFALINGTLYVKVS